LTIQKRQDSSTRVAWISDFDFEVPNVSQGHYDVVAHSEDYDTSAEIKNVRPGQFLKVVITVQRKAKHG